MLSMIHLVQEASPGRRVRGRTSLRAEEARRLARAIDALPETQRLALALRFYESLRPSRIALVLGMTEAEVETLLADAVRGAGEILRAADPDPRPASRSRSEGAAVRRSRGGLRA